jgi:uncharacterized protein (UPF0332 family)
VTEENRRKNVGVELERAAEALRSAVVLRSAGLHRDSVSRAYFAALHLACAMLLSDGLQPRTHRGTVHMFTMEYVRSGLFPPDTSRMLSLLQADRETADYESAVVYNEEHSDSAIAQVEEFRDRVEEALRSRGFLDG